MVNQPWTFSTSRKIKMLMGHWTGIHRRGGNNTARSCIIKSLYRGCVLSYLDCEVSCLCRLRNGPLPLCANDVKGTATQREQIASRTGKSCPSKSQFHQDPTRSRVHPLDLLSAYECTWRSPATRALQIPDMRCAGAGVPRTSRYAAMRLSL